MNRKILFRGLRADGQGWVYGDLVQYGKYKSIRVLEANEDNPFPEHIVLPESVGQFNSLYKCFEGDILNIGINESQLVVNDKGEPVKYEVRFDGCEYTLYRDDFALNWGRLRRLDEIGWFYMVIGNIHEGGSND